MTITAPLRGGAPIAPAVAALRSLGASVVVLSLALPWPGAADAAVPAQIRRYEVASLDWSQGPSGPRVALTAYGRDFLLDLYTSPVLSASAETVRITEAGVVREPSRQLVYRGTLAEDADADVRVAVVGSSLTGRIRSGKETWFLEPLGRYQRSAEADQAVVYRSHDVDPSVLGEFSCGATPDAPGGAAAGTWPSPARLRQARSHGSALGLVELTVVADYQFFATHGADSAATMQNIVDQVAAFYPAELGLTLSVVRTVIHESPEAETLTSSTDSKDLLISLAQHRYTQAAVYGAGDVTHLFTGRDLDRNTIGIAYIGEICDAYYAASLAQDLDAGLSLLTLLTGHELGHVLGAWHDGEKGSPCEAAPYGFVMWPTILDDLAEEFSTCTRDLIETVADAASCLSAAVPADCGNGVLDEGEDCDDGANLPSDCCRIDCFFDPVGAACGDDGNDCSADVCDGAGTCVHPPQAGVCDDADACTTDGTCSEGLCLSLDEWQPMASAKLKARLHEGDDNDVFVLRGMFDAALATPPVESGVTLRFLDEDGLVFEEVGLDASLWIDKRGAGRRFTYDSRHLDADQGPSTAVVRFKPSRGQAKVRIMYSKRDLPFLAGRDRLGAQVLLGDAVLGDCASAVDLDCRVAGGRLSCS